MTTALARLAATRRLTECTRHQNASNMGTHLPRSYLAASRKGWFACVEHLRLKERAPPWERPVLGHITTRARMARPRQAGSFLA
jgi:hypothetical protein